MPFALVCLVGLVLISIPLLGHADEVGSTNTTVQTTSSTASTDTAMPALDNGFTLTNGMVVSCSLEYSKVEATAICTNEPGVVSLTVSQFARPDSDFGEFVIRHMTENQEFRFVTCDLESSRMRKALASVSAGYGEFFNNEFESLSYRGSNGTRREFPGFLFVRSQFEF